MRQINLMNQKLKTVAALFFTVLLGGFASWLLLNILMPAFGGGYVTACEALLVALVILVLCGLKEL